MLISIIRIYTYIYIYGLLLLLSLLLFDSDAPVAVVVRLEIGVMVDSLGGLGNNNIDTLLSVHKCPCGRHYNI